MKKIIAPLLILAMLCTLTACGSGKTATAGSEASDAVTSGESSSDMSTSAESSSKSETSLSEVEEMYADTVVYGKIYTSNENHDVAEAFAVKDGKYIYVGDADGAKAYIKDGVTEVIDKRGEDSLIMAGATEGHGHYILAATMQAKGFLMTSSSIDETLDFIKNHIATHPDEKLYFTYGWDNVKIKDVKATTDMRAKLDEICSDKIVVMMDNTGHNAFLNSKAIEAAGLTAETEIEGGYISKDENGRLLGLVSDVATNYVVANVIAKSDFMNAEDFVASMQISEDQLHSYGYTNYFDGYTSFFGEVGYEGISEYDKKYGMTINVGASYKIDPFCDYDEEITKAGELKKKYSTTHFMPNSIKLFADGECVESLSGWVLTPYKDGTTGTQVWEDETINSIVKKANASGLSAHIHTSGDGAVQQAVNAFIAAEDTAADGILNCVAHTRNVTEETLDLMAEHNIFSATNICWRIVLDSTIEELKTEFDTDFYMDGYPMKSLLERGIIMTSSTDYPSNAGAPCDIANIMELAVNGTVNENLISSDQYFTLSDDELITIEQAIDVMTINGAKQLGIEDERGSIEVGKYADFLFLNKDILTCASNEIHEGTVNTVYFEGREVYAEDKVG